MLYAWVECSYRTYFSRLQFRFSSGLTYYSAPQPVLRSASQHTNYKLTEAKIHKYEKFSCHNQRYYCYSVMNGEQGRTQSLARMNLGHEPEFYPEIFKAETIKTAIHQDAHCLKLTRSGRRPVMLLQQRCHV